MEPELVHAEDALDDATRASLTGTHAALALRRGRAVRFLPDVSPFAAVPKDVTDEDWDNLRALARTSPVVLMDGSPGVETVASNQIVGLQMVAGPLFGRRQRAAHKPSNSFEIVRLGPNDADDMLALANRTRPGPFARRTGELGVYFGARHDGTLVAMAGERLRPQGWSEISGVCTDEAFRGRGLARRLMTHVADSALDRGARPFLHVVAANTGAIRLYESMGYVRRRTAILSIVGSPFS